MATFHVHGETGPAQGSDPSKRLEWLNSRAPAVVTAPPKPAAPKVKFRANPIAPRPAETRPVEPPPAEAPPAKTTPVELPATNIPPPTSRVARATPSASAKPKPAAPAVVVAPSPAKAPVAQARSTPAAQPTPAPIVAAASPKETRQAKATPAPARATPAVVVAAPPSAKPRPGEAASTPAKTKAAHTAAAVPPPVTVRPAEVRSTPVPKPTPVLVAQVTPAKPEPAKPLAPGRGAAESRHAWKTGIVTTVFWIGEPVGGRNFTPNFASSWDPRWTQAYGGFDTPDPAGRRNFIPVKFVPRLNPFYIALPYNDVTRGTTKPESRLVIPWFKEAFQREGVSVCRDRWLAVRNREGKVGYAQWSDCGPFRTDHWQYVFGKERPKPNLNKGAGLDVSPALRDYLGLGSTDVTDWKFVETSEVPGGPWALYGENNVLARKGARPSKATAKTFGRPAKATPVRVSQL